MKRNPVQLNCMSNAKLMRCIAEGPATVADIADETGLWHQTIRRYVRALHAERVIYVARWEPDALGRHNTPAYSVGKKPDVRRVKMTRQQVVQRYRANVRARAVHAVMCGIAA